MLQFPRLIRGAEAIDISRITRKAVYCMIARGEVPGVIRVNRRVLVDGQILLSWIGQRTVASPNQEKST